MPQYIVSPLGAVHIKTSPPTPLLSKERGDKAQLYRGEVLCTSLKNGYYLLTKLI